MVLGEEESVLISEMSCILLCVHILRTVDTGRLPTDDVDSSQTCTEHVSRCSLAHWTVISLSLSFQFKTIQQPPLVKLSTL